MSDGKGKDTESTVLGLPQVADTNPRIDAPVDTTAPSLEQVAEQTTAPSLAPVTTPPAAPPRTKTAGAIPKADAPPPRKTGAIPAADAPPPRKTGAVPVSSVDTVVPRKNTGAIPTLGAPARKSRVAQASPPDSVTTAELTQPMPDKKEKEKEPFEWTMGKVAGVTGAVCFLFVATWVFWPSGKKAEPRNVAEPEPVKLAEPQPIAVQPKKVAEPAPVPVAPKKPTFDLDSKANVIDPYAAHMQDIDLDPAHKYRLSIARDDSRLGVALARLDEKGGWGVMRKMASHAVLQFGGAKALRLHCEPGSHFQEGQTMPLELVDLANKQKTPVPVNPALHCWDFEVARVMELGEGVKKRVRVPTDSKVVLGEKATLRVAYVLESLGGKKEWRTGVLNPGESVLAEGRLARFAILDSYAGDNEGTLGLELLSGDTENSGLVTPSTASGAEFVIPNKTATPSPPAPSPEPAP